MIALQEATKKYGSREAVSHLSFTVPKGQIVGLLGRNGAGKTTTLNMLTGYLAPSSGRVLVDGIDMLLRPLEAKKRVGYLPEQPPLYDEMTPYEYLAFACRLKAVKREATKAHIAQIAGMTGLEGVMDKRIGSLSKGYRQRAALAQALCGAPDVIVLDEPTVGLDPKQTAEFRQVIKSLGGEHTVLFSTHILSEAQAVCDRVLILNRGKMIFDSLRDRAAEGGVRLLVSILGNNDQILPALRSLACAEKVIPQESEQGLTDAIIYCRPGTTPQRELFTLLAGLNAPIMRLNPLSDTLEDVFLRATADEREEAE